jgi:formylglycine-generating enzyme required for sulfatase activity
MFKPPLCLKEYRQQMVVVAAGEFLRGSDRIASVSPEKSIYLSRFLIGMSLVTVAMYEEYCLETDCRMPPCPDSNPDWEYKTHPIVNIRWEEAKAFADWAKLLLPTEAQWEKAALGPHRQPPQCYRHNDQAGKPFHTVPAGYYSALSSSYGMLDLECDLWEWCEDWYRADWYEKAAPTDPTGPPEGEAHVLRGCCACYGYPSYYNCLERRSNGYVLKGDDWGFRLATPGPA